MKRARQPGVERPGMLSTVERSRRAGGAGRRRASRHRRPGIAPPAAARPPVERPRPSRPQRRAGRCATALVEWGTSSASLVDSVLETGACVVVPTRSRRRRDAPASPRAGRVDGIAVLTRRRPIVLESDRRCGPPSVGPTRRAGRARPVATRVQRSPPAALTSTARVVRARPQSWWRGARGRVVDGAAVVLRARVALVLPALGRPVLPAGHPPASARSTAASSRPSGRPPARSIVRGSVEGVVLR